MKGLSIPDPDPEDTSHPDDENDELIPGLPEVLKIGNRKRKRQKGVRSSYGDRLKELQKFNGLKKEEKRGD